MAEKFSLGMEPLSPFVSTPVDASPLSSVAELSSQWQGPVNTQSPDELELPEYSMSQSLYPTLGEYRSLHFRAFSIATDTSSLSSGFPYSQRLVELGISPDQWLQFSNQVVSAAKLQNRGHGRLDDRCSDRNRSVCSSVYFGARDRLLHWEVDTQEDRCDEGQGEISRGGQFTVRLPPME